MEMNAVIVQNAAAPASSSGGSSTVSGNAGGGSSSPSFAGTLGLVMNVAEAGQAAETQKPIVLPWVQPWTAEEESGTVQTDEEQQAMLIAMIGQWLEQPEQLESLMKEEAFSQWFRQAEELIKALGGPTASPDAGRQDLASSTEEGMPVRTWTSAELKSILESFTRLVQQHPDSGLVEQLKEKLGELVLASQAMRKPESSMADPKAASDDTVQQNPQVQVPERAASTHADPSFAGERQAQSGSQVNPGKAEPVMGQLIFRVPSEPDVLSRLEMIAGRSGSLERQMSVGSEMTKGAEPVTAAAADTVAVAAESRPRNEAPRTVSHPSLPQEPIPAERFAGEMSRFVLRSFTTGASNGFSEARLSLYPEHLGHVDVKLTMQHGQLTAQFIAHTLLGKEMLEAQMSQLRAQLQSQGIQVERMEVTHSNSFSSHLFQDQRDRPSQQPYYQQSKRSADRYEEDWSLDSAEWADVRASVYGSNGFDVTA